jgi:hypothetical protein
MFAHERPTGFLVGPKARPVSGSVTAASHRTARLARGNDGATITLTTRRGVVVVAPLEPGTSAKQSSR